MSGNTRTQTTLGCGWVEDVLIVESSSGDGML